MQPRGRVGVPCVPAWEQPPRGRCPPPPPPRRRRCGVDRKRVSKCQRDSRREPRARHAPHVCQERRGGSATRPAAATELHHWDSGSATRRWLSKIAPRALFCDTAARREVHVFRSQAAGAEPAGQAVENHTNRGVQLRQPLCWAVNADKSPLCPVTQVSLSAFAFLFSELVQYNQSRVSSVTELERKCVAGWLAMAVLAGDS